ncbi:MAG TPA: T9SS type A sorting domain-containing protein, partial [Bacteroidetes bacterium]|nr:T9SS type A sorting domain-containing protein [Bacteroidota bacterium]
HGTRCAGVIVGDGTGGDTTGVAPGATLMVLRNWAYGWSSEATHFLAVQYAVANGAQVISCSMSYDRIEDANPPVIPDYVTHRIIQEASLAAGVIQANSTGNNGDDIGVPWNVNAPANCPPPFLHPDQAPTGGLSAILACGFYRETGIIDNNSDVGPSEWYDPGYPPQFRDYPWQGGTSMGLLKPDVVGPSRVKTTTLGGAYYLYFSGSSASAPNLAGGLALLRSMHQQASPERIAEAIKMTAEDAGDPGHDNVYGAGRYRVDLAHAYLDSIMGYGGLFVTAGDAFGDPVDSLEILLDDGEVRGLLREGSLSLPRVLPGLYTLTATGEGWQPQSVPFVQVSPGDTTRIALMMDRVHFGIDPPALEFAILTGDTARAAVTLENDQPGTRNYTLSARPRGGVDWEVDTTLTMDRLAGVDIETLAAFDSLLLVAGVTSGEATLWRFTPGGEFIDSVSLPVMGGEYGLTGLDAGGDSLLYGVTLTTLYTFDHDLNVIDSLALPTSLAWSLAYDDRTEQFFVGDYIGSVFRLSAGGDLLETYDFGAPVAGLAFHAEDRRGAMLFALTPGDPGQASLMRRNMGTGVIQGEADLAPDGADSAAGLDLEALTDAPFWDLRSLHHSGAVRRFRRELRRDAYDLPADFQVPPGGAAVEVAFHGPAMNIGRHPLELVWENRTDGWTYLMPVVVTVEPGNRAAETAAALPEAPDLLPPYPNPFNSAVTIRFRLAKRAAVRLEIVDLLGRRVALLADAPFTAGEHGVRWEAGGRASGMYFAVLRTGGLRRAAKLLLLK